MDKGRRYHRNVWRSASNENLHAVLNKLQSTYPELDFFSVDIKEYGSRMGEIIGVVSDDELALITPLISVFAMTLPKVRIVGNYWIN